MAFKYFALAALAASVAAQATPAQIALVDAQWVNSGLDRDVPAGFGLDLKSTGILSVEYSNTVVSNGQSFSVNQVSEFPNQLTVTPTSSSRSSFSNSTRYTLILADASSLGDPDPEGNYRHYLANNVQLNSANSSSFTLSESDGAIVVTSYAAPGPLAGSGPHRYAWQLFSQPDSFSPPSNLSATGVSPGHWSVSAYVQQAKLTLIAASFFTVENSVSATGSVAMTSSVNTATLQVSSAAASSTGAAASSGASRSASTSASRSAAPSGSSTSTPASSAGKVSVSVFGALAALVGIIALA